MDKIHHIPTIYWLLNPDCRGDKRSMTIAATTVLLANERPGQPIQILDHNNDKRMYDRQYDAINYLMHSYYLKQNYSINKSAGTLTIHDPISPYDRTIQRKMLQKFFLQAIDSMMKNNFTASQLVELISEHLVRSVMEI